MIKAKQFEKAVGDLESEQAEASRAIVLTREFNIGTVEELEQATEILQGVKEKIKELDTRRKSVVTPLNGVVSEINSWFRPVTNKLKTVEKQLKDAIAGYHRIVSESNRMAQEEAGKASSAIEAEEALAKIQDVPKMAGVTISKVWDFEVEDEAKVPEIYKVVNEQAIRLAVRAGTRKIPGVRIFKRDQVSSR